MKNDLAGVGLDDDQRTVIVELLLHVSHCSTLAGVGAEAVTRSPDGSRAFDDEGSGGSDEPGLLAARS